MLKHLLKQIIFLLVLLLSLSVVAVYLLNTESGLKFDLALISKIIPGKLSAEKISGTLLKPITIDNLSYENKSIKIYVAHLFLELDTKDLLLGNISIKKLYSNNLKIIADNASNIRITPNDMVAKIRKLQPPSFLQIENAEVYNVIWQQSANSIFKITKIILSEQFNRNNIMSLNGGIYGDDIDFSLHGSFNQHWDLHWKLQINNLNKILSDANGLLISEGTILGAQKNPVINFRTIIQKFKYGNFSCIKLDPINVTITFTKLKNIFSIFDTELNGVISCKTGNLAFLDDALPHIQKIHGQIDIQYKINGTLQNPKFLGEIKLTNTTMQIPDLNIELKNINLIAHNVDNKIDYKGSLSSGDGTLNITGSTTLFPESINSNIEASGTNILAINTKEYKVIVSPQITLNSTNNSFEINGKIFIPFATIKPVNLNANNSLPQEITYVKKENAKQGNDLNLTAKIQLILGDNVTTDIMDLKGKLKGNLIISEEPKKITQATGTLEIENGTYNIYNQQLKITKGNFHFFGGAATNPEVNIEAVRDFKASNSILAFNALDQELIVGIKMHGMLDNVKVDLFSTPSGLSKSDILSYLIIGQPSEEATGNKAQLLLQAASALNFTGVGEINNLVNKLQQKLGLSELGLGTETYFNRPQEISPIQLNPETKPGESLTTNTAFVLGKFLTPRVYVGYSLGLLDPISTFRVRYSLGRYWSIQSESSTLGTGADLIYTIERD